MSALRDLMEGILARREEDLDPVPSELVRSLDELREQLRRRHEAYQDLEFPVDAVRELFLEGLDLIDSGLEGLQKAVDVGELRDAYRRGLEGLDLFAAAEEIIGHSQQGLVGLGTSFEA